ncbi:MAG: DUF3108 domain-containing protein [Maricaulaceae bacterium]
MKHLKHIATTTVIGAAIWAASSAFAAPEPEPTNETLISQTRNYADLNAANHGEARYDIPAPNAQALQFKFKLKGYVFGLRMIKANYAGYVDDETYAAYADIKTSGLGALLKKMEIWAVSKGRYGASGLTPDFHVQQNMDKKNRRVEMNYDNARQSIDVNIIPALGSQGTPPASPEERYAADDTISAVLHMMMQGKKLDQEACSGSVSVFDSKQHYNLRQVKAGGKRIKFKGQKYDAIRCLVYYEPVNGFDAEDLPDTEEGSTPIKAYFIAMPEFDLYVPVRFTYKISSIKAVIKLDKMDVILPQASLATDAASRAQ